MNLKLRLEKLFQEAERRRLDYISQLESNPDTISEFEH